MLSPLSPRIIAAFTTAVGAAAIGLAVATAGTAGTEIAEEVLSQTNLTTKQAAYFVVDATKAYCPQYASQLT